MRVMVRFSVPTAVGNEAVKSGKVGKVFEQLGADFQPEAMYFHTVDGKRGGFLIMKMEDSSLVAGVVERLSFGLQAKVELIPVMAQEDLDKGLGEMGTIIEKYA